MAKKISMRLLMNNKVWDDGINIFCFFIVIIKPIDSILPRMRLFSNKLRKTSNLSHCFVLTQFWLDNFWSANRFKILTRHTATRKLFVKYTMRLFFIGSRRQENCHRNWYRDWWERAEENRQQQQRRFASTRISAIIQQIGGNHDNGLWGAVSW